MSVEYIATPKRTKELLNKYGFNFKKKFGQNFLIDNNVLNKIVVSAEIGPNDGVIEIGPGIGALTQHLATAAKKVVAFEVDKTLVPLLDETLADFRNVSVVFEDILTADVKQVIDSEFADCDRIHVVANLPYYITTPILNFLLTADLGLTSIVVMMQKEVALRLQSSEGSKEYGSLAIFVQMLADVDIALTVPRTVFMPQPNVDSAVLRLRLLEKPRYDVGEMKVFEQFVQAAFKQRRKTLANNWSELFGGKEQVYEVLTKAEINPNIRAENLSIAQFVNLFSLFNRL
ncbi:16S rRNA (adenine(1518)-N(6)/adenine(1519)-N(6))-dimethyltransferase RsmA [Culicoidibacter larvae]|uniref:Ribosomal RNA small subunit methyltransferase A n=1 Tax=Culicoidibacter larvae TaxID=2579976 RepID=A0A5R8QI51_9FIRM|nr:16S rRNA (adenine(1518)-N(6)/adenine(1519)-N(6))-dimethyltransferase RsmA [Culicoidibacter larvae]TLG77103.1 16S rRNA (adenine(1518)-N(6)/adenine(1519)-N(6))-dimethyltransferase RsmA [Culicoidibacter larvae]